MGGPAAAIRFRIRICKGDDIAIGPGKVDLLEAIGATGSITAAAKSLGMSYRRAWLLVDTMNRCFEAPVVESDTLTWRNLPALRVDETDPQAAWLDTVSVAEPEKRLAAEAGGRRGGGTHLTSLGEELVRRYRMLEAKAQKATAGDLAALAKLLR